ncbi:MAG: hypothetical protein ACM3PZ_01255 [Bacillota bacterium]
MKAAYVLLLALLISIGQFACAQAIVKNPSSEEMEISSRSGTTIINPGQEKLIPWLPPNGSMEVTLRTRSGRSIKSERMSLQAKDGRATLTSISSKQDGRKVPSVPPSATTTTELKTTGVRMQDLVVENLSGHRFVIIGQPNSSFVGLALADKAISSSQRVPTGLHQLSALLDMDAEGKSTGKNFAQAVIKFIVVEGDEKITIRPENVVQIGGELVKARLRSLFPFKVVIVSTGELQGKAMRSRGFLRGVYSFNTGFNTMSIQYFKDGVKYQSDVEFIVTREEKIISVGESALRNTVAVSVPSAAQGGYSTF